ncbi:iron complex transport system ATP-binding protein [Methanofollis sp. W23]|uniref:ABC transporter ATP-binding protein n=1 Tax=Methanofollis sp. W23 TaxID=2817849 RepID=UPI001AE14B15|nr:ABC transporter ATP-binding protein [Methanofollis sp. W23]MBP2145420.1 iron complex transport system ATP-binding protein [Methanofollis sp. W23]
MFTIDNLSFRYTRNRVLEEVTVHIPKGSLCALYGPNGSGKSTLLKCCLGLLKEYTGTIAYDGQPMESLDSRERAKLMAYVPQSQTQTFPFTAFEIVLMGRNPYICHYRPTKTDEILADRALDALGVSSLRDRPITELSGGEKQLVTLARALNQDTPLLFLDEPSSALDYSNQLLVWSCMRTLASSGKTVIVTTHDPNHVLWYCSHVAILKRTILDYGDPEEVISEKNLSKLYGPVSTVMKSEGRQVVLPTEYMNHFNRI